MSSDLSTVDLPAAAALDALAARMAEGTAAPAGGGAAPAPHEPHDHAPTQWPIRLLAGLAAVAATVWMRDVLAPLVTAALMALIAWPAVARLRQLHVPTPISAILGVVTMLLALSSVGMLMRAPIADFAARWPQTRAAIEQRLVTMRASVDTEAPASAASAASGAAAASVAPAAPAPRRALRQQGQPASAAAPAVQRVSWWEAMQTIGKVAAGRAQLAATALFTFLLSFFAFVAFGHRVVRAGLQGLGRTSRGRALRDSLLKGQAALQAYWLTLSSINLVVALLVTLLMWLIDMPHPPLWGLLAGLLNFIPVVGPLLFVVLLSLASVTAFDSIGATLLPPCAYLCLHLLEGQLVTPMLMGRRLSLNPAVVVVSIVFWTWAWGMLGTLLAVPLLLCLKNVCDHNPELSRLRAMLE